MARRAVRCVRFGRSPRAGFARRRHRVDRARLRGGRRPGAARHQGVIAGCLSGGPRRRRCGARRDEGREQWTVARRDRRGERAVHRARRRACPGADGQQSACERQSASERRGPDAGAGGCCELLDEGGGRPQPANHRGGALPRFKRLRARPAPQEPRRGRQRSPLPRSAGARPSLARARCPPRAHDDGEQRPPYRRATALAREVGRDEALRREARGLARREQPRDRPGPRHPRGERVAYGPRGAGLPLDGPHRPRPLRLPRPGRRRLPRPRRARLPAPVDAQPPRGSTRRDQSARRPHIRTPRARAAAGFRIGARCTR